MAQAPETAPPLPPVSEEPTQPIPLVPLAETRPLPEEPEATVRLRTGALPEPIAPSDSETRRTAITAPRRGMPIWRWAALALLVLLLGLGGVYFLRPDFLGIKAPETEAANSDSAAPSREAAEPAAEVPPALRSYLEKAEKGDAAAMRMLGVMYYNGLNVPKNEAEGLKWYRKAADAGSAAAQKELKALEGKATK